MSVASAVLVGGIGKLPHGGLTMYYVHYLLGLQELGLRVHYVERQNRDDETYDPATDEMTDRADYAVRYLGAVSRRFGFAGRWSFIDREGRCHGAGWERLRSALDAAEVVITIADPTWFEELERCPRRIFVDGDPMFTQVAVATGEGTRAEAPRHYDTLFTYGARLGSDDCLIPDAGLVWHPTRPVAATRWWRLSPPPAAGGPYAALMHWAAGREVHHDGEAFGHKDREFAHVLELPRRRSGSYLIAAAGGHVPRAALAEAGWRLLNPLEVTAGPDEFIAFVHAARADLGVAKHAYVRSRSGWFSDRSTCFLAAGRPVLHQDTGFGDWLPDEGGVLSFDGLDSLVEAIDRLERDYEGHARAAREVAERHFEAREVIGAMLETAGVR